MCYGRLKNYIPQAISSHTVLHTSKNVGTISGPELVLVELLGVSKVQMGRQYYRGEYSRGGGDS